MEEDPTCVDCGKYCRTYDADLDDYVHPGGCAARARARVRTYRDPAPEAR